jgi:hypothetical protein
VVREEDVGNQTIDDGFVVETVLTTASTSPRGHSAIRDVRISKGVNPTLAPDVSMFGV